MTTEEFRIAGMSCGHCVASVQKELAKLPRVTIEEVRVGWARVTYDGTGATRSEIKKAIEEAGFALLGS
jgi:copper chaperone CopZ